MFKFIFMVFTVFIVTGCNNISYRQRANDAMLEAQSQALNCERKKTNGTYKTELEYTKCVSDIYVEVFQKKEFEVELAKQYKADLMALGSDFDAKKINQLEYDNLSFELADRYMTILGMKAYHDTTQRSRRQQFFNMMNANHQRQMDRRAIIDATRMRNNINCNTTYNTFGNNLTSNTNCRPGVQSFYP